MANLRLLGYRVLRGTIETVTALRIGGSKEELDIGGLDLPVIKDPITRYPYIPGSSLKGKMRNLLEQRYNAAEIASTGRPAERDSDDPHAMKVIYIFGRLPKGGLQETGPTRILVRDARLSQQSIDLWKQLQADGRTIFEEKSETAIDRKTGSASGTGTLRKIERVPPGIFFDFEIAVRVFEGDDRLFDRPTWEVVQQCLTAVEQDALGGMGSRGNGKVKFHYTLSDLLPAIA